MARCSGELRGGGVWSSGGDGWEGKESLSGRNLPSNPPHPPASLLREGRQG